MFTVSHNVKKKAVSVSALLLCYPINEELLKLMRWFFDTGSSEVCKGDQEISLLDGALSARTLPLERGRCLNNGTKLNSAREVNNT
jgi:hypothetical protein